MWDIVYFSADVFVPSRTVVSCQWIWSKQTIGTIFYIECLIEEGGARRQRKKIEKEGERYLTQKILFNLIDCMVQMGKETRKSTSGCQTTMEWDTQNRGRNYWWCKVTAMWGLTQRPQVEIMVQKKSKDNNLEYSHSSKNIPSHYRNNLVFLILVGQC